MLMLRNKRRKKKKRNAVLLLFWNLWSFLRNEISPLDHMPTLCPIVRISPNVKPFGIMLVLRDVRSALDAVRQDAAAHHREHTGSFISRWCKPVSDEKLQSCFCERIGEDMCNVCERMSCWVRASLICASSIPSPAAPPHLFLYSATLFPFVSLSFSRVLLSLNISHFVPTHRRSN